MILPENVQNTFKKVGGVLIAIGILDIGLMVYCILHNQSYGSSLNIFAVIAGVLLYRGGLRTARILRVFSAFFGAGLCALLFWAIIRLPKDLLLLYIKLQPRLLLYALLASCLLILPMWVYRRLSVQEVLDTIDEGLKKPTPWHLNPKTGVISGLGVFIVLTIMTSTTAQKCSDAKALDIAVKQVGAGYKFYVSGYAINWHQDSSGAHSCYRYNIVAYNENEIKNVSVTWGGE